MCKEYQEKHKGSNLKQCQKNFLWKCKLARNCIRRSMKFCWLKQRTFDRDVFSNMKCSVLVGWYIKIIFLGAEKKFSDKMFYIQCHNRNILIGGINCVSFVRPTFRSHSVTNMKTPVSRWAASKTCIDYVPSENLYLLHKPWTSGQDVITELLKEESDILTVETD